MVSWFIAFLSDPFAFDLRPSDVIYLSMQHFARSQIVCLVNAFFYVFVCMIIVLARNAMTMDAEVGSYSHHCAIMSLLFVLYVFRSYVSLDLGICLLSIAFGVVYMYSLFLLNTECRWIGVLAILLGTGIIRSPHRQFGVRKTRWTFHGFELWLLKLAGRCANHYDVFI